MGKPGETAVESKALRAVRFIVFEDSEHDIAKLTSNGADGRQVMLSLRPFLLIKSRKYWVMKSGDQSSLKKGFAQIRRATFTHAVIGALKTARLAYGSIYTSIGS